LAQSCRDVGDSICAAWAATWTRLSHTYSWSKEETPVNAKTDPIAIQADLRLHVSILERELAILLEMADSGADAIDRGRSRSSARFERTDYRMAFYMTALMDLARETAALLALVEEQKPGGKRCYIPWLFWPLGIFAGRPSKKQDPTEGDEESESLQGSESDVQKPKRAVKATGSRRTCGISTSYMRLYVGLGRHTARYIPCRGASKYFGVSYGITLESYLVRVLQRHR
jgi:hypothetical protein